MASLMNSEPKRVHRLFLRALHVVEDSFEAERIVLVDGKPVSTGPDHYARLAGAKRFLEIRRCWPRAAQGERYKTGTTSHSGRCSRAGGGIETKIPIRQVTRLSC